MLSTRPRRLTPFLSVSSIPSATLGLYVLTSIFYIFPSGNPQPADFLLLLGFALSLILVWQALPRDPALYLVVGLFLGWITLVNSVWFMMTGEVQFLKKTSFYIYNALIFVFVASAGFYDFEQMKKAIRWSCIAVLFFQVAYLEFATSVTKRAIGTFNNPNQMGYWALLVMTCLVLARERTRLGLLDVLALCAGMYATMLTLSKSAVISALLLLAVAVVGCGVRRHAGWLLGMLLAAGVVLQLSAGNLAERIASLDPVSAVMRDLSAIDDEGGEDIEKRGYQRLFLYPQYLIFGAGEGDFARFGTGGRSHSGELDREFHSSLGNILLSYGIVGLVLFLALLAVVFVGAPWTSILYLLPSMLYGIAHNGLRFSLFWVFLGMVLAQARHGAGRVPARAPAGARRPGSG